MNLKLPNKPARSELKKINKLADELGFPDFIVRILWNRGYKSYADITELLSKDYQDIFEQKKNLDNIRHTAKLILNHKDSGGKFFIYGDYDVDGITSTTLLWRYLYKKLGADAIPFVPHRKREGYGLNIETLIEKIDLEPNPDKLMLITVDCGVRDEQIISKLKSKYPGIKIIITDHHKFPETIAKEDNPVPSADAFLHPLSQKSKIMPKEICAATVTWLLTKEIDSQLKNELDFSGVELAALGTVCDIMPLTGINRKILQAGLEKIKNTSYPGLKNLIKVSKINATKYTSYHLGFQIGPRLNAAGRIGEPIDAVKLLSSDNDRATMQIASKLNEINEKRRDIMSKAVNTSLDKLKSQDVSDTLPKLIILRNPDWEEGIVGLIAGRIQENFNIPTIAFTKNESGDWVGSARSNSSIDITDIISKFSNLVERYGGHEQAAGLTVSEAKFEEFVERIQAFANESISDADLKKELHVDGYIHLPDVTLSAIEILDELGPFGAAHPRPKFHTKFNHSNYFMRQFGRDNKHLAFKLEETSSDGYPLELIWFNHDFPESAEPENYDFVGSLDYNEFRGQKTLQFIIKHAIKR